MQSMQQLNIQNNETPNIINTDWSTLLIIISNVGFLSFILPLSLSLSLSVIVTSFVGDIVFIVGIIVLIVGSLVYNVGFKVVGYDVGVGAILYITCIV